MTKPLIILSIILDTETVFAFLSNMIDTMWEMPSSTSSWPRFVVSMDPLVADYEGIRHLKLRDFLRDGLPG